MDFKFFTLICSFFLIISLLSVGFIIFDTLENKFDFKKDEDIELMKKTFIVLKDTCKFLGIFFIVIVNLIIFKFF